jgi:NAD(P)H-hydrate epimerase
MKNECIITMEYVKTVIMKRKRDIHKGDCGKVLVVAGSKGMAGAAVLCGKAALRAGAGLVRVAVDEELFPIIQTALPEATCVPRKLSNLGLDGYDAVAVGPGLGDDAGNDIIIEFILNECSKTVVLDADGLNSVARTGKAWDIRNSPAGVVITPHMAEAKRLVMSLRPDWEWPGAAGRAEIAGMLAEGTSAVAVLKGAGTIVASKECGSYTNTTGNPGMATGGSGDALTGIIAALAGQGLNPWDSAKAGVYIHGRAGDLAASKFGEFGLTAMDIAEMTALAIKEITE